MPIDDDVRVEMADGTGLWTSSTASSDKPGMVFLHGGPGMWDYLGPVAELAQQRFHTHRYDQRGCGRSDPSVDYRMSRYVADLDELREHFGYDSWYIFGHSFGAELGLHYASTHPDRAAALIYCGGRGLDWTMHRPAYRDNVAARLSAAQARRCDELEQRARTWDEEVEWRTLCWLPDFADSRRAAELAGADAATRLPLNLDCNRALSAETASLSSSDERAMCARITAPVWLIHGAADPRPLAGVEALADALRAATPRILAGAGHQPWRERPELVRSLLLDVQPSRSEGDSGST